MTLRNTADASVQALYFEDDGATPNSRFPVLFYRLTLDPSGHSATAFEALFAAHGRPFPVTHVYAGPPPTGPWSWSSAP